MIKESKPITMAEVASLAGDTDKEKEMKSFVKKFVKMDVKKAKEMVAELESLDLIKLKEEHLVKIADFCPKDNVDLIKVLGDISLDQEESTKVLDVTKKY